MLFFSPQLFVGLSFPYEGPAPLEAIANGCAFLNPKFTPPKSSKNTDFFKGKPTLREVRWRHSAQRPRSKCVCVCV
jgi:alpha-1,3(6)-mannosylglycoprotein beta-1,6-N-acetyl-glucosaminyltransferase